MQSTDKTKELIEKLGDLKQDISMRDSTSFRVHLGELSELGFYDEQLANLSSKNWFIEFSPVVWTRLSARLEAVCQIGNVELRLP